MANIKIEVGELECRPIKIVEISPSAPSYSFKMTWESDGDYLYTIDPTVTMYLKVEIFDPATPSTPVGTYNFSTYGTPVIEYNAVGFMLNIKDYYANFSPKNAIKFTFTLAGEDSCVVSESQEFAPNTLPNI